MISKIDFILSKKNFCSATIENPFKINILPIMYSSEKRSSFGIFFIHFDMGCSWRRSHRWVKILFNKLDISNHLLLHSIRIQKNQTSICFPSWTNQGKNRNNLSCSIFVYTYILGPFWDAALR